MTNVTKTQLLSQSETEAFLSAMNTKLFIMKDGHVHEVSSIAVTPQGLLKKPIKADLTDGTIYDNILTPANLATETRGYKSVFVKNTDDSWVSVGAHRLIHFADTFEWSSKADGTAIHHVNSITYDNRASNLKMLTNSDNVLRFFDGRDNQEEINNQQYLNDRINLGTVPLIHKGKLIEGYTINTMGEVFHYVKRTGQTTKLKPAHASKKYRMNLNVNIAGVTASLHNLMAENFLVTPNNGKYKTLMKDRTIANPYQPQNLYTVAKKHQ
ncbi:hypothetical protein EFL35_03695 [Weissella paramesenteroides]|uniref:HNH endonuclease n=1 Tax=Weissella paramesenteroides TaxID=1249 RepID=UPI00223BF1CA|nr:HNH endonuclease [Weissella paramesenteroides]MCS9984096.1 hypothetical protein [Weissella paramesenteroides]MCS9997878.1 hypothetical protein [Weissella paramesenteroides]MCT0260189.1 hypothetical protein [Weissella paramesenteroides]